MVFLGILSDFKPAIEGDLPIDLPLHECLLDLTTKLLVILIQSQQSLILVELISPVGAEIDLHGHELLRRDALLYVFDVGLVLLVVELVEDWVVEVPHTLVVVPVVVELVQLVRAF